MIIRVCTFTEQGERLAKKLFDHWQEMLPQYKAKNVALEEWTKDCFDRHLPILFIGACGIAVRVIAPFVKDKLTDGAVMVADERGRFVIPLLSGHAGGANALSVAMAERLQATPVLTTATDVEGLFSVDVFARENGLRIINREGIRAVSGKLLRGERVSISWEEGVEADALEKMPEGLIRLPFEEPGVDVRIITREKRKHLDGKEQALLLVAKEWVLGIGCKKGKTAAELRSFLEENLSKEWAENTCAIASIDLKAKEEGLWELAQYEHLPFFTFPAETLQTVKGDFAESAFVLETTGVGNVCERAALCAAGADGELIREKVAGQGMTLAVAKRKVKLRFGSKA